MDIEHIARLAFNRHRTAIIEAHYRAIAHFDEAINEYEAIERREEEEFPPYVALARDIHAQIIACLAPKS